MDRVRAHVWIAGSVQGVNFRAATRDQAREARVDGWVCNLPDGRVEAVFEGERAAVQRLVSWCYSGPAHSRVDGVKVAWEQPNGAENGFSIVW
jgi:acylphosphatase